MPDPAPHRHDANIVVSLMIEDPAWRDIKLDIPLEDFIEALVRTTLMAVEIPAFDKADAVDVSMVLMNDDMIQHVNKEYRKQDKPTNVLSFPQFSPEDLKSTDLKHNGFLPLGDILLARETIEREAAEQGKDIDAHIAHMVVHGTLHLLGYDHEDDAEAQEMEQLETLLLSGLGYDNPYET